MIRVESTPSPSHLKNKDEISKAGQNLLSKKSKGDVMNQNANKMLKDVDNRKEASPDLFEDYQSKNPDAELTDSQFVMVVDKTIESETLKTRLLEIDPTSQCCAMEYLKDYSTDILVKEFIDAILETEILPCLPDQSQVDQYLQVEPLLELSSQIMQSLINNFMAIFQTKYFMNQVTDATIANVELINPKTDFWMPQYALLPMKIHDRFNNLKRKFSMNYQQNAVLGVKFARELMIARNFMLIQNEVKKLNIADISEAHDQIMFQFVIAMTKSTVEFGLEYNTKNIDWEKRKTKSSQVFRNGEKKNQILLLNFKASMPRISMPN